MLSEINQTEKDVVCEEEATASQPRRNLSLHQPVEARPGLPGSVKSRVLLYGMWPCFHGVERPLETPLTQHLTHCSSAPAAVCKLRDRKGKPGEVLAARDLGAEPADAPGTRHPLLVKSSSLEQNREAGRRSKKGKDL